MRAIRRSLPALVAVMALLQTGTANAADAAPTVDPAVLARIRDAAMSSDWAYQRLTDLADTIGPRLSGSPGAEAAVDQVAASLRALGLRVQLQPVKVPHWVRGEEHGELVGYAGRPAGVTQKIVLTALGGSGATPVAGLVAPVLVLHSMAEIDARAADINGKIVVVSVPFDQNLADNGLADEAYSQAAQPRFQAPAALARLGAVGALVRSAGSASYRLPHTGSSNWPAGVTPIPSAALTVEDELLIERLAARGPVTMNLTLTPRTLPDADSHNVIADLPGREFPDQVVLISGHLDSWDLGTGAIDDGMGLTASMGAVALLKSMGIVPRRTVRFVAWMNEENGARGGDAYFESVKNALPRQVAAVESDMGLGRPLGILTPLDVAAAERLGPVLDVLRSIGAGTLDARPGGLGTDIWPLQQAGVAAFEPIVDNRHYFDFHHTAADTLDKVEPDAMRRQVAVLAVLAYFLAETTQPVVATTGAKVH